MKKMNVIPLIMSVFLLFSCSEQEQIDLNLEKKEDVKSYQEKGNNHLVSGVEIVKLGLEDFTQNLNCRIEFYEAQIEEGNEQYHEKYEVALGEQKKYKYLHELLNGFRLPGFPPGGIGPINPPNPCEPGENLDINYRPIDISAVSRIVAPKRFELKINFFDLEEYQLIGRANQVVDIYNDDSVVLKFESEHNGLAIAESTYIIEGEEFTTTTLVKLGN